MVEKINQVTRFTFKERKRILKWLISLPEEEIVSVIQSAVRVSFQLKDKYPKLSGRILKYSAIILAASNSGWKTQYGKGYRIAGEEQFEDFSNIRVAKAAALINRGRKPELRRKILSVWGEVVELKSSGIGFRGISSYLKKHRKIKVSASYLLKIYHEMEND